MIDLTKPVQTRDGRKARIICTDRGGTTGPVITLVQGEDGGEIVLSYFPNGQYCKEGMHRLDLINVPEKRTIKGWLQVYSHGVFYTQHKTQRNGRCIASIPIEVEYEVGQGL